MKAIYFLKGLILPAQYLCDETRDNGADLGHVLCVMGRGWMGTSDYAYSIYTVCLRILAWRVCPRWQDGMTFFCPAQYDEIANTPIYIWYYIIKF